MSDNQQRAAAVTGCVVDDSATRYGPAFCATHDEDGNPPWERCRWASVAAALDEAEARGRGEVAAKISRAMDSAPTLRFANDYPVNALPVAQLLDLPIWGDDR